MKLLIGATAVAQGSGGNTQAWYKSLDL